MAGPCSLKEATFIDAMKNGYRFLNRHSGFKLKGLRLIPVNQVSYRGKKQVNIS